ncbi:MAG: universal stress protein [Acidobacteria bacterium]|nr:universal stress protein [Acidobacteriota bacterium]
MFERIVIPLDGSPRAELILGQVARILRREDSEILLLRVVNDHPELRRADAAKLVQEEREEAQRYIHDMVHRIASRGAKVHGRIAEGSAAETILDQAATEGATLIAMSTHGRTGLARWIMGSVAEKVVRACPIPVLLVRSFRPTPQGDLEPATAEEFPFRKILVPTDGSPAASAVLDPARKFAQLFDSGILVLHAELPMTLQGSTEMGTLPLSIPTPSEEDAATARVTERFRQAGLRAERRTVVGDPAAEILDLSHAQGIDLIAMATHGRSGFSRWVLGSVAERVLRHAGIPLLLVRAEQVKPRKKREAGRKKVREFKS